jgi:uncharacterized membrane protein
MANAKARTRSARTSSAVSATPTSRKVAKPAAKAEDIEPVEEAQQEPVEARQERPSGQPLWLQITTFVLAILGLAISAYETYAHYNGSHLAGCPTGGNGTFNCTAVITSPQSMVFNVLPVAVLGLAFYVVAVALFSPWLWRMRPEVRLLGFQVRRRDVNVLRLASVIVGMGFVMYLIYAELTIGSICEYCTGVHIVTFVLFVITVFSAAIWGLSGERE